MEVVQLTLSTSMTQTEAAALYEILNLTCGLDKMNILNFGMDVSDKLKFGSKLYLQSQFKVFKFKSPLRKLSN